jgi:hypothetical protein
MHRNDTSYLVQYGATMIVLLLVLLAVAYCSQPAHADEQISFPAQVAAAVCHATGNCQPTILPTAPGAANPDITQDNIDQTICDKTHTWTTRSIRPPAKYTTGLKIQQLARLGWKDQDRRHYEEDHIIAIEDGGNPTDPNNLWPESYLTIPNAHDKDHLENYVHQLICERKVTLVEGQRMLSVDWVDAWRQMPPGAGDYHPGASGHPAAKDPKHHHRHHHKPKPRSHSQPREWMM